MRITSFNPRTGQEQTTAAETTAAELDAVCVAAAHTADIVAATAPTVRRQWLNALADALENDRERLVALADEETALGPERCHNELNRTIAQTRFYGDVAVEGSHLGVTIDDATDSSPTTVRVSRPVGPVAVFGASNFPFVLGVVGHDTTAAIAAGCPVIAKAHRAHLGLSLRLAELTHTALDTAGAPDGVFEMVVGHEVGVELVKAPQLAAVAFTGSEAGGRALWAIANQRPIPIPVYAEMGTVNPIVVTPNGAAVLPEVARGFVATVTANAGQFCTKPGLLFTPQGSGTPELVAEALRAVAPSPVMLTEAIAKSVHAGIAELRQAGARLVEQSNYADTGYAAPAALLAVDIDDLKAGSRLLEECFGPVAIVCEYRSIDDVREALLTLQNSLVAAIFTGIDGPADPDVTLVVEVLEQKVGRIVFNGWTTGAAHGWAQNHGGPWPATSDGRVTSIGAASLHRFVRPIAYQAAVEQWLPEAARSDNPWNVTRRVNGVLHQPIP